MDTPNVLLTGFGNVGRAFVRLMHEKRELCRKTYDLDLRLRGVFKTNGGLFAGEDSDLFGIEELSSSDCLAHSAWKTGLRCKDLFSQLKPGVLVECTPTNIHTGEPGLSYIRKALEAGWHIAAASKGALVVDFKNLKEMAKKAGVCLKYSAATAAALPTLDVGLYSLAGTEILGIEGILTGTANYILSRMEHGISFQDALKEAQARGIAEPDPSLDIDGWDTASKILLISNSVAGTDFELKDIPCEGIRNLTPADILAAREEGKSLKLVGWVIREVGSMRAEVRVAAIDQAHPLGRLAGTQKGITFYTDTMGQVTVAGGKSDPRGTAATLLKDIINIFR
jgi:homoserine dehydrogenase